MEGLLARGADLHARDNDGFDALVAAATGGTAEVCRLLLGKGLDPNIMAGSGGSPLMIAARAGATEAVKVLLEAGATADALGQPSAAFVAEIHGLQAQSEEGLTEHEAESRRQRLEAYFEDGSTALMYAAALGHHDVVALLVQAGADARLQDRDQFTTYCLLLATYYLLLTTYYLLLTTYYLLLTAGSKSAWKRMKASRTWSGLGLGVRVCG